MDHGMEAHPLSDGISEGFLHLKNERFVAAFNEMFEPLAELERLALLESARHDTHADGDVIMHQGSKNQAIYVLVHGELQIVQEVGGNNTEIAHLGVGAVFGEMSFTDLEGASASVIATGDVEVLYMDGSQINNLFATIAGFESRFFRSLSIILSRRLRVTNTRLCWKLWSGEI
jgi:CRP-like cAMP-binding protein